MPSQTHSLITARGVVSVSLDAMFCLFSTCPFGRLKRRSYLAIVSTSLLLTITNAALVNPPLVAGAFRLGGLFHFCVDVAVEFIKLDTS